MNKRKKEKDFIEKRKKETKKETDKENKCK